MNEAVRFLVQNGCLGPSSCQGSKLGVYANDASKYGGKCRRWYRQPVASGDRKSIWERYVGYCRHIVFSPKKTLDFNSLKKLD
jgi:hypothetical protein